MAADSTRNRTWVIVLVIVAVLLLCCCLILIAGWFLGDPILEFLQDLGYDINLCLPLLVG
jgi:hypothetical protein